MVQNCKSTRIVKWYLYWPQLDTSTVQLTTNFRCLALNILAILWGFSYPILVLKVYLSADTIFFFIRECFGQRKIDPIKFIKRTSKVLSITLAAREKKKYCVELEREKIYSWPKQLFFHLSHQTLCFHVIEPNCWHLFLVFPLQMGPESVKLWCLSETIQLG